MKKILKGKNGVTLVALVVTVIILIILAAITINLTIGENGIITTARQAGKNYQEAAENEQAMLAEFWSETEGTISSATCSTNQGSTITISLEDLNKMMDEKIAETKEEMETKMEEKIAEAKESTNPAGTAISYIVGNEAPSGYLKCDGTVYNISDYQTLADAIKNGFGSYNYYGGDGTTTFAVPDLRGEFLRGTGTNSHANQGSGASVGVHQDGTMSPSMVVSNGYLYIRRYSSGVSTNIKNADWASYSSVLTSSFAPYKDPYTENVSVYYTSRPTNTSVLYCIKY